MKRRQTINEWEIETGIKIRNLKGIKRNKNKANSKKYTKDEFRKILNKCEISVRTQKGIDFLIEREERNEQWKSYIDYCENKQKSRFSKNNKRGIRL